MRIVSDFSPEHEELSNEIKINSRLNYGMPRETVEKRIEASLQYDPEKSAAENGKNERIEHERFLKKSLENLEFSVGTFRCLKDADIKMVQGLIRYSEKDLRENKNFGLKSVNEIR